MGCVKSRFLPKMAKVSVFVSFIMNMRRTYVICKHIIIFTVPTIHDGVDGVETDQRAHPGYLIYALYWSQNNLRTLSIGLYHNYYRQIFIFNCLNVFR